MPDYKILYDFLLVFGIVVNFLILLLLVKKSHSSTPHTLLLIFFLGIFSFFLNLYGMFHGLRKLYIWSELLVSSLFFLLGPLAYFYIRSLFSTVELKSPKFCLHFTPFLLHWLLISVPLTLERIGVGIDFPYLNFLKNYPEQLYLLESIFFTIYLVQAYRLLRRYKKTLYQYYAEVHSRSLNWSNLLLLLALAYVIIGIFISFYLLWADDLYFKEGYIITPILVFIVAYLGYHGFFQSRILIPEFLLEPAALNDPPFLQQSNSTQVQIPAASIFSDQELKELKSALEYALGINQVFKDTALTLSDLAQHLSISDKKLSTFLNQDLDTNFYELINRHRIEAFKSCILQEEKSPLTIWGIASECGFPSKTSFYRVFKQQTGQTPSEFVKNQSN